MSDGNADESRHASLLAVADRHYHEQNWSGALMLYRAVQQGSPAFARERGVSAAMGHCLIELRDDADPGALARELIADLPPAARVNRAFALRDRTVALCRAGDFPRARRLLKFLSAFDLSLGLVYLEGFIKGRTGCWEAAFDGPDARPGFLARDAWSDDAITAAKARFRDLRLLLVVPLTYPFGCGDRYTRSAGAYGLTVKTVDRDDLFRDVDTLGKAARLQEAITDFAPDVILVNSFAEARDADQDGLMARTGDVLRVARQRAGAKVAVSFSDVWFVGHGLLDGLGDSVDLVHHTHPLLLQDPALSDPRVYCYFHPVLNPPPTVDAGTIARACSIGSINTSNAGRMVWWAEAAQSGLPFDFIETAYEGAGRLSAERYAELMREYQLVVNFNRRTTGVKIVTARAFEVLTVGGVLLDEDSVDARYFLQPREHYLPFETWSDLAELIPSLLADREYRQHLADTGHRWVQRHFSGDWFWTGLLHRLFPERA